MNFMEASEIAQQVKALAAKPDNLSSIPERYMVEGENHLLQEFSDLHTCARAHTCPHLHTHTHVHTH